MEDKQLHPHESLAIINSMISTAKNRLADNGFYYIFWGWLVFACAAINYASLVIGSAYGYYVWPVLLPLGAIVSIIYGVRQNKKETVKTYIDSYLAYCWWAFGIALFITLVFMSVHSIKTTYFFLMLLYGMATFISGGIINFRPLVIGGIFSFICAVLSVFVSEREQYLCIALSLLGSYIIPGHLLHSKYKSQEHV